MQGSYWPYAGRKFWENAIFHTSKLVVMTDTTKKNVI